MSQGNTVRLRNSLQCPQRNDLPIVKHFQLSLQSFRNNIKMLKKVSQKKLQFSDQLFDETTIGRSFVLKDSRSLNYEPQAGISQPNLALVFYFFTLFEDLIESFELFAFRFSPIAAPLFVEEKMNEQKTKQCPLRRCIRLPKLTQI